MTLLRLFAFKPMQKEQLTAVSENVLSPTEIDSLAIENVDLILEDSVINDHSIILPESQSHTEEPVTRSTILEPVIESISINDTNSFDDKEQQLANEVIAIEQQAAQIHELSNQDVSAKSNLIKSEVISAEHIIEPVLDPLVELMSEPEITNSVQPQEIPLPQMLNDESIQQAQNTSQSTELDSPLSAVLATRNMLRSRKKQLDKQEKKPGDAIARQPNSNQASTNESNAKNVDGIANKVTEITENKVILSQPKQPYQAENINPATIRKANQVDKWAHMIDSMELTARLRQLAIHATIDKESTDEHLILCLDQATKHLVTESAQQQLQENISQFLSRQITVTIKTVEETVADPYQIQSHINDRRYDYAKELLQKDDIVQALQNDFQANLDEDSISAL
jgi:DNA polymerase-3 subunit gamma/tau